MLNRARRLLRTWSGLPVQDMYDPRFVGDPEKELFLHVACDDAITADTAIAVVAMGRCHSAVRVYLDVRVVTSALGVPFFDLISKAGTYKGQVTIAEEKASCLFCQVVVNTLGPTLDLGEWGLGRHRFFNQSP